MSELAEQIQNPAVPEFPALEVSPESPETPQPDYPSQEAMLSGEIAQLWQIHNDFKTSLRQQSQNLHSLRAELGKKLAAMKALLATPGRAGKWSSWLKQNRISRATADRLVLRHERSLNPDGNCLNEAISEPTEEEIKALFDKVAPRLRRALPTPASVYRFLDLLSSSLALNREDTEEGFIVIKPAAHVAVEQSVSDTALVEPVPVIADILLDRDAQSTSTGGGQFAARHST